MKEMILRIQSDRDDADVLIKNGDSEIFKKIKASTLIKKLIQYFQRENENEILRYMPPEVIAYSENCRAILEPEEKRVVIYDNRSYNIHFPNALYLVKSKGNKIVTIEAYAYKKWDGLKTMLYKYPMPNMLGGNRICLGSSPRQIKHDDYKQALDLIIYTQYSHNFVDNIKSFKNTKDYFSYLEKNKFPYDLLIEAKKKASDLFA